MDLEAVQEGARYVALFWHLRTWAYKQRRGPDLGDWKALVLDECYAMNELFPKPFRGREVRAVKDTAYSVSVWTWKRLIDYGRYRTPELQAARGRRRREIQRKGTPLEHDRQPWLRMGNLEGVVLPQIPTRPNSRLSRICGCRGLSLS